jgi:hypothetical protein
MLALNPGGWGTERKSNSMLLSLGVSGQQSCEQGPSCYLGLVRRQSIILIQLSWPKGGLSQCQGQEIGQVEFK